MRRSFRRLSRFERLGDRRLLTSHCVSSAATDGDAAEHELSSIVSIAFAEDIDSENGDLHAIIVDYTDLNEDNIDASTIGVGDIAVRLPSGKLIGATFVEKVSAIDTPKVTGTYLVNAPGGTWEASDNGTYQVVMRNKEVSDVSGAFVRSGVIGDFVVEIPDNVRPTAIVSSSNASLVRRGDRRMITVTYTDNVAVDRSSIGFRQDIELLSPDGTISQVAFTRNTAHRNSATISADYSFEDRDWLPGTYTVLMRPNEVGDSSQNTVAGGPIGEIQVGPDLFPPQATANAPSISAFTKSHSIEVIYTDDTAIDASTIGSGDIEVVFPDGRIEEPRTLFGPSFFHDDYESISVVYQLQIPDEGFGSLEQGTYVIRLQPDAVRDVAGRSVPAVEIGSFRVGVDDEPPTATVNFPDITEAGHVSGGLTVVYTDEFSVDTRPGGIDIVRPDGTVANPVLSSTWGIRTDYRPVTYGWQSSFDSSDNGTYIVRMKPGQVSDLSGNVMPWGEVGRFEVRIDDVCPTATATARAIDGEPVLAHEIAVTYADNSGISLEEIGPGDIEIEMPDGRGVQPQFIAFNTDDDATSVTATYRLVTPMNDGPLGEGHYSIRTRLGEVSDTSGNRLAPSEIGSFRIEPLMNDGNDNDTSSESIPGDADGNGRVNFADFLILSDHFGQQVDGAFADGDFNADGFVGFDDFLVLSNRFGGPGKTTVEHAAGS